MTPAQTCATCRFHLRAPQAALSGECHGAPPSVLRHWSVRGLEVLAVWPVTQLEDWCGAWQMISPLRERTP